MSSSAAIAEPGELLKKVRISCFSADRLASEAELMNVHAQGYYGAEVLGLVA